MKIGKSVRHSIRERIGTLGYNSVCNLIDASLHRYVDSDLYYSIQDSVWDQIRITIYSGVYQVAVNSSDNVWK